MRGSHRVSGKHWTRLLTPFAGLLAAGWLHAQSSPSSAAQLRDQAQKFTQQAAELRAQGRIEEADRSLSRAAELDGFADSIEKRAATRPSSTPSAANRQAASSPPPPATPSPNATAVPSTASHVASAPTQSDPGVTSGAVRPPDSQRPRPAPSVASQSGLPTAASASRRPSSSPLTAIEKARQLQQLELAIESLHAAGRFELANQVAREADALRLAPDWRSPAGMQAENLDQLESRVSQLYQAIQKLRPPDPDPTP